MPRVIQRPQAIADILDTWDYIAEDSESSADRWVDQLDRKLQLLATQPKMGRHRDELAPGLRSQPFGRHVIFYMAIDDGIDVVRVLHSARDIVSVFADDNTGGD